MAQLPFSIAKMLGARAIAPQIDQAIASLSAVLKDDPGTAFEACVAWQLRFDQALRTEIPGWAGLAGFRIINDLNVPPEKQKSEPEGVFPAIPAGLGLPVGEYPQEIDTADEFWQAYGQFFGPGKLTLHSGKLRLTGAMENHFLRKLKEAAYEPTLGGQAGNILWLWQCIGARLLGYVPQISADLVELVNPFPGLGKLELARFEGKKVEHVSIEMLERKKDAGIPCGTSRTAAPTGGSAIVSKEGRRLILQITGFRDLRHDPGKPMPWDRVQFLYQGRPLLAEPLKRKDPKDCTWPIVPLFSESYIENGTLVFRLAEEEEVGQAFVGAVDFAVLGGMGYLFGDAWLTRNPLLQAKLREILMRQLHTLAASGIRIGLELSGIPGRSEANLIQDLCREGILVAIGINGEDELPNMVGTAGLTKQLYEFWLDTAAVCDSQEKLSKLQDELNDPKGRGECFEYATFLRAKHLAEVIGVRTLYVHTTSIDFVLRRDADPGSLLRAQLGDMMGKGLVIAALLQRAYGDDWLEEIDVRMPPAVNPRAMARLGRFAQDFAKFEGLPGAEESLLHSGYWLAPSPKDYSLAVVPVMWPPVSETGWDRGLPEKLNPTGSGDMSFGAFFFLGGL